MGKSSVNSVSRVLRRFRNSLGQGCTPALSMTRNSCVRQFALISPVSSDDELEAWFRQIEALFQVGPKFWEHRNDPGLTTDVMLCLGASDSDPVVLPVHVDPPQRKML